MPSVEELWLLLALAVTWCLWCWLLIAHQSKRRQRRQRGHARNRHLMRNLDGDAGF